MFKKLRISLIFINLVFFKSLSLNQRMHQIIKFKSTYAQLIYKVRQDS